MVRIKERYLLVNILYPPPPPTKISKKGIPTSVYLRQPTVDKLTFKCLAKAIRAQVSQLFGDYGAGALEENFVIKYLSLATSTFIIRCARAHYRLVWSALTFMNRVPITDGQGLPCIFRVVRTSGTIRKVEEEAIRQAKKLILAAKDEANSSQGLILDRKTTSEQGSMMLSIGDEDEDSSMDDAG